MAFTRFLILATLGASMFAAPAFAQERDRVMVTTRVIYPGETVPADALREVTLKAGRVPPPSVVRQPGEIEGRVARRTLVPGRYITLASLRDAYVVEQGAAVHVVYDAGSLTISTTAVTLEPGGAGDIVKLRNVDSGKVFTGVVMADGSVRVGAT